MSIRKYLHIVIFCFVLLNILFWLSFLVPSLSTASASSSQNMIIVIDPGNNPKSCNNDTVEKSPGVIQVNWDIAKKLEAKLRAKNYNTVLTKKSVDDCVSNKDRAEVANKNKASLFLRLQVGGFGDRGYYTVTPSTISASFITAGNPAARLGLGRVAAYSILSELGLSYKKGLISIPSNPLSSRNDASLIEAGDDRRCYQLTTSSCYSLAPTMLLRIGNFNNEKDKAILTGNKEQEEIVNAITDGILAYSSAFSYSKFVFGSTTSTTIAPNLSVQQKAVDLARSQKGKNYLLGACHGALSSVPPPNGCSKYDCSGLVRWAWYWASDKKVNWLSTTAGNWEAGHGNFTRFYASQKSQLQVGDLVYFGPSSKDATHVGIYAGSGSFIQAGGGSPRSTVVESKLSSRRDFIGFLRPRL